MILRALPNVAALAVLIFFALTADAYDRLQREPVSYHLWISIFYASFTWVCIRVGVVYGCGRR